MATVLSNPPAKPTKFDAKVDQALGQAVGRIRVNDLLTGGAAVGVATLCYAVGMIALDSRLDLPMWVRQLSLGGFTLILAAVAYVWLVRPLRRAVNPRYAARRVEATAADAKNAVINWVDLKDRELPESVRAAVGQKAVAGLAGADVHKATESRSLVWLGATLGLLLAALALLFVLLKPAPFYSLVSRAFNPFVQRAIATRTYLTLTEPAGGDLTVTSGEPVNVAVEVDGRIPDPEGSQPLKLLVRYTQANPDADSYPLTVAETSRTWRATLPPDRVQNGFWYQVVGGDTETLEHRVTVRTRPLFTGFEVAYESPAYTRIRPATVKFPTLDGDRVLKIDGYRGTRVTLTAAANRPVKSGWVSLPGEPDLLRGEVIGESKGAVRFRFDLKQSGPLRHGFVSADDEASAPGTGYSVRVLTDAAPLVTLDAPADAEVTLPANGRLDLEATISDDFGIDTVELRLKRTGAPLNFQPVPYRGGKSFRREDGSYPTALTNAGDSRTGYKETVQLTDLKDATGRQYQPQPGDVIEYWLEATDNCTEPKPNVGKSAVRTIKIAPAVTDPPKKEQIQKDGQQRQAEQKQHEAKQDEQLQGEKREPKQAPGAQQPPPGDKPPEKQDGDPGEGQPGGQPQPNPKSKGGEKGSGTEDGSPSSGTPDPKTKDDPQAKPKDGAKTPEGPKDKGTEASPKADGSKPPEPKAIDKEADRIRKELQKTEGKGDNQPGQGGTSQQQPEQAPMPQPPGTDRSQQGNQPSGPGQRSEAEEKEKQKAIDDLGSDDPAKQQAARDKLDKMIGEEQRKRAEKLTEDLKSGDKERVERARKELGELDRETGTGGAGVRDEGRKEDIERLIRDAQDLDSPDDKTRQDAERKFDERLGRDGRERLQKDVRDLKGSDPTQQKKARNDVDELVKKEKKNPKPSEGSSGVKPDGAPKSKDGPPQKGGKPDPTQLAEQAKDLASDDKQKREAAEKEFDQRIGEEERKQLQQAAKDLKSGDAQKQQAAKEQIDKAAQEMAQKGKPSKEEMAKLAEQARDLNSPDDTKREAAEKALDQKLGKQGRVQLQKDMKDLNSPDKATKEKAEQRIKDKLDQAAGKGGEKKDGGQPGEKKLSKEEADKLVEKANDLNSPDDAKRQAAEKEFDKAMGKDAREQMQRDLQDLESMDKEAREKAQKRVEKMAKDAAEKAGKMGPSKEDIEKLAEQAKDLTSSDDAKRKAAEQKLDEAVGKDAREMMQKELNDLQSQDPATKKAAQDRLNEAMKKLRGGNNPDDPAKPFEDNPLNRLKSAQLQLEKFEKTKANNEALKQLGYTEAEFEKFLAGYRQRVAELKAEAEQTSPTDPSKSPTGPPTVRVGEGSGGKALTKKDGGPASGGPGPGTAPPGYDAARKKFAEEAAKLKKPAPAPKGP